MLRGFVRLVGLHDCDPIGVNDAFATNSIPVPRMAVAVECMWGEREKLVGQRGTARRQPTSFQYNF